MLKTIVLVFGLFCGLQSVSQKTPKPYKWPGFVQLNDSVFISEKEISIRDYAEYIHMMKIFFGSYSRLHEALPFPNTLDWIYYNHFEKRHDVVYQLYEVLDSSNYNKLPSSRGLDTGVTYLAWLSPLPVVNLTKTQALLYCELRTKAYDTLYKNTKRKKQWRLPEKAYFRLPTIQEFQEAAQSPIAKGEIVSKDIREKKGSQESIPAPVYSGYRNQKGVINILGNVAEIVLDSDFAYGGSYRDSQTDCTPSNTSFTKAPQTNIGFRIVAVIVK